MNTCLLYTSGDEDTSERLNYKIAEYSLAVVKGKPHFHVSFIMNVSPECDCWNHNDAAIVPDLGILASFDPVALDKACADLVIQAPILHKMCIRDRSYTIPMSRFREMYQTMRSSCLFDTHAWGKIRERMQPQ